MEAAVLVAAEDVPQAAGCPLAAAAEEAVFPAGRGEAGTVLLPRDIWDGVQDAPRMSITIAAEADALFRLSFSVFCSCFSALHFRTHILSATAV